MAVVKIQTGLRLDETTYEKLRILAFREGRSLNNLVEYIVKRYLEKYESQNGAISLPLDGQVSTQDL